MPRYYLMASWQGEWQEVDKAAWIRAERDAGFRPKMASDDPRYADTPATGGFSGGSVSGRIESDLPAVVSAHADC